MRLNVIGPVNCPKILTLSLSHLFSLPDDVEGLLEGGVPRLQGGAPESSIYGFSRKSRKLLRGFIKQKLGIYRVVQTISFMFGFSLPTSAH